LRRENPRILAARALGLVRQALYSVRRAKWMLERRGTEEKGLLRYLEILELTLERIALRLETIATTGIMTPEMILLPRALIQEVSKMMSLPQVEPVLSEIDLTLSALAELSQAEIPETMLTHVSEEARRILREIEAELEKRGPVRTPSQADSQARGAGRVASGPQTEGPAKE